MATHFHLTFGHIAHSLGFGKENEVEVGDLDVKKELQITNSFAEHKRRSFWQRTILLWTTSAIFFILLGFFLGRNFWLLQQEGKYDRLLAISAGNLGGKFKPLGKKEKKKVESVTIVEIDEIFGNEFIKKKEVKKLKQKEVVDIRAQQVNQAQFVLPFGGGVPAVDLDPHLTAEYPLSAKQAGVEARITVVVVTDHKGRILKVATEGEKIGYGLEEVAIDLYQKKRYKAGDINNDGKPDTTKTRFYVDFFLEN